jgi:2'-5' RNA ligase
MEPGRTKISPMKISPKIRSFIAINLPPGPLIDGISSAVTTLKAVGADVLWVRAGNLHLTLKFLGDVDEAFLVEIGQALKTAAQRHAGFKISFQGVGCFPNVKRPRVVWVGIREPDALLRLQAYIETAMEGLGFEREAREFSPHLTIGRVRTGINPASNAAGTTVASAEGLGRAIAGLSEKVFGALDVESISLMKSKLSPAGPEYTRLMDFPASGV